MNGKTQLQKLHACSSHNRSLILSANKCYCFYCKAVFDSREIEDYADNGQTAICPKCSIDSVIPDSADDGIDEKVVTEMHEYWF